MKRISRSLALLALLAILATPAAAQFGGLALPPSGDNQYSSITQDSIGPVRVSVTYKDLLPGASVQLIVNNLLDEDYEHPGVQTADGADLAASIPQPGRTVYARITWGLRPRKTSS